MAFSRQHGPGTSSHLTGCATGTPADLDVTNGDFASVSSALRFFLDTVTGVVDIDPGDPETSPTMSGSTSQSVYTATANWDACLDLLGPAVSLIKASKVQVVIRALKRIPFLGGKVDDIVGGSAAYMQAHVKSTITVLSLILSGLDFFGEDDNVIKDAFFNALNSTEVDVQREDGTIETVWAPAALILVVGSAEIIDNGLCKNWAGWEPAKATVSATGSRTGQMKVTDEQNVNGYLNNIDIYSPGSVEWTSSVETGDIELVGPDLYTGS